MAKIFIANIPVWHGGLVKVLRGLGIHDKLIVISAEIANGLAGEEIDERRLPDSEAVHCAKQHVWSRVELLTLKNIEKIRDDKDIAVSATDDEVTRRVIAKVFPKARIAWLNTFSKAESVGRDAVVIVEEASVQVREIRLMMLAEAQAKLSPLKDLLSGAVLSSEDGRFLGKAGIRHLPTEFEPFLDDNRLSIAHPIAILVALSARNGLSIMGSTIYSTDFPCTTCAKIIGVSGIKTVFVKYGNNTRSLQILRAFGVKVIRIVSKKD